MPMNQVSSHLVHRPQKGKQCQTFSLTTISLQAKKAKVQSSTFNFISSMISLVQEGATLNFNFNLITAFQVSPTATNPM